ncbi:MAG: hypothetical protein COU66_01125, partial [Candidatus Pacebacteria bacterium CG10_big_fil_rev_8_21_14_0_10_44_11]
KLDIIRNTATNEINEVLMIDPNYESRDSLMVGTFYYFHPVERLQGESVENYIDEHRPAGCQDQAMGEGWCNSEKEKININDKFTSYKVEVQGIVCSNEIFLNSGDLVLVVSTNCDFNLDTDYINHTVYAILSSILF